MSHLRVTLVSFVLLSLPLSTNAALIPQLGGDVLFDDDLNIVYLADMRLAASQDFGVQNIGVNGEMNWFTANNFIAAMNAFDGGNGWLGINNWRMPDTLVPDPSCDLTSNNQTPSFGFDCTGSEMGHLYYVEFGLERNTNAGDAAAEAGFKNLLTGFFYWSATEATGGAYDFSFAGGSQATLSKGFSNQVLPVANVIPVPAAAWLFGSGLLALAGLRRRQGLS